MNERLEAAVDTTLDVAEAVLDWIVSTAKRTFDASCHFVANAVPRRVVYWCAIRMLRHASNEKWDQPFPKETNELLYRWAEKLPKEKVNA